MLELKNISKSFGKQEILKNLHMKIKEGKIYSLVGGNGTGKTTIFNLISGFLIPDEGEIYFNNKRLKTSSYKINLLGIVRTFQDLRLITQLTVKENILLSFKNNPYERIRNACLPPLLF